MQLLSRLAISLLVLALLLSTERVNGSNGGQVASIAFSGAAVIDVRTGSVRRDATVVISGDRITQIGTAAQIPSAAKIVDSRGKWIIPGLIDMHEHIGSGMPDLPLNLFLAHGVTTVRDTGGNTTVLRLTRDAISAGKLAGPRLFISGPVLDDKPVFWPANTILADTPERAASAVNFLADQGVDCVKVYNSIKEPVLKAIVATAHRRKIPVIGHIPRSLTMTRAVELGMDCLEHIRVTGREMLPIEEADKIDYLPTVEREIRLWERFDLGSAKFKRLVEFLAARKVFVDPTLTMDEAISAPSAASHPDAEANNRVLPRKLVEAWSGPGLDAFRIPGGMETVSADGFAKRKRFVRMLVDAGVRILAGTDGPNLGYLVPGFSLHHELELLVGSGLTPLQALQAATINAAQALWHESELGSLEPGKFADLLVLDADPLQDIRNAGKIRLIVKAGQAFEPADLLKSKEH